MSHIIQNGFLAFLVSSIFGESEVTLYLVLKGKEYMVVLYSDVVWNSMAVLLFSLWRCACNVVVMLCVLLRTFSVLLVISH